jgi:hypothetical protein
VQKCVSESLGLDSPRHYLYILSVIIIQAALTFSLLHAVADSVSAGSPGMLVQDVNLSTGYNRQTFRTGPFVETDGFDGTMWKQQNGITATVDLPALVADNISSAYLLRLGWEQQGDQATRTALGPRRVGNLSYDVTGIDPPGGSHIEAWFDARTHLLARAIISTDRGPDRIDYSDYRHIGNIQWPFRQRETNPTGAVTDTTYRAVHIVSVRDERIFEQPARHVSGTIEAATGVHFQTSSTEGIGLIISPLRIGGTTIQAVFDTGGQGVIDASTAQRFAGRAGGLAVGGTGTKSVSASVLPIRSLLFANGSLPHDTFFSLPLPYELLHPLSGQRVDAIVGAEIMANFRVVIDYAHRILTLQRFDSAPVAGTIVPFLSDGSHMYVEATIDGARGLFGIDTGDEGGVTVFGRFAQRNHLYTGPGIPYLSFGIGGADREFAYRGHTFELAGNTMENPAVRVARTDTGDFSSRSLAGNIGAGVLSRFLLTIDYHARTITFSPNDTLHAPFPSDRTGLTLDQPQADSFRVIFVASGTPAAQAGIHAGDRIVGVDKRSVTGMGLGDFDVYRYRAEPFTLTIRSKGSTRTLLLRPRPLLPSN